LFSLMLLRLNAVGNKNSQHRSEEASCINYPLLIRAFFLPYMPNMQVNWLLALYIDLPGLLEDPRFCFVTQSSLTPGVDILAVSAHQVFWYSPECTFMRALDAKLLRPNARMQRLVHNWINSTFKQKQYTAVHFRGKMTSCRESWPRNRQRNNMPMTIESIRDQRNQKEAGNIFDDRPPLCCACEELH
jgi:hypothetical protein